MSYISVPLDSQHRKSEFACGKELLDVYLHTQANQDIKRKLSACFVVSELETNLVKAYYTLSNSSIPLDDVPEDIRKSLPKSYTSIPTTLLGRLAIDDRFQGKGLGKLVLVDALKRAFEISKSIGSFAIIVDPLDTEAESFYKKYGFIKLPDSGKMFLTMKTVSKLFT
ncbi:MAG TPA: GNAT family N-acetyltransferase [Flavobacteriaceae bacterium]|nr:GNAT family N-acetyltransferase [Flavobacteriaceae bacterium]